MKFIKKFLLVSFVVLFVIIFSVFALERMKITDRIKGGGSAELSSLGKDDCLKTAGYTWDNFIRACVRNWEFDNEKRMAARLAVNKAKTSGDLAVLDVKEEKCPGCFKVQLERAHERISVALRNWNVIDLESDTNLELSEEKCLSLEGRIINKSSEKSCNKKELNAGYVSEFGKNFFCCIVK